MKMLLVTACLVLAACSTPHRLTYASGFSFANYDTIVFARSTAAGDLFGLDVELGNLLGEYGMRIVGDKEYETLSAEAKTRTLIARIALGSRSDRQLLSITFDDSSTGKSEATITKEEDCDMLDPDDRAEALDDLSDLIIQAIKRDKGLLVSE